MIEPNCYLLHKTCKTILKIPNIISLPYTHGAPNRKSSPGLQGSNFLQFGAPETVLKPGAFFLSTMKDGVRKFDSKLNRYLQMISEYFLD